MARVAHRCNPTAPPVGDGDANADLLDTASLDAASAVLDDMRCPASARGDLASWLRRHVVAATQRRAEAPRSWQWNLTCVAWAVHAAGADNPAEQQQAFRSLGITEATARQLPFRAWREGRSGLAPGVTIPGMRARTDRHRRQLGLCGLQLTVVAEAALDRLVEVVTRTHDAGTRTPPPADVEMRPPDAPVAPPQAGRMDADGARSTATPADDICPGRLCSWA